MVGHLSLYRFLSAFVIPISFGTGSALMQFPIMPGILLVPKTQSEGDSGRSTVREIETLRRFWEHNFPNREKTSYIDLI